MAKFKVGDEVIFSPNGNDFVERQCCLWGVIDGCKGVIVRSEGKKLYSVEFQTYKAKPILFMNEECLELINPHPEEIEHNGRTYVLKPEPPHEWKFGDWARHETQGVVFIRGGQNSLGELPICGPNSLVFWCGPEDLTYISSAEIPE